MQTFICAGPDNLTEQSSTSFENIGVSNFSPRLNKPGNLDPWGFSFLDNKRLGKQRVEGLQLINAILSGKAWSKHPAAVMWGDCIYGLVHYTRLCCRVWKSRGFQDTVESKLSNFPDIHDLPWWANESILTDIIQSHRANLIRKEPTYYGRFWSEDPRLPYIWPDKTNPKKHP